MTLRQLMACSSVIDIDGDQVVLLGVIVELRAGIGVRDRNLDGLDVEALGEIDGVAKRVARFAGQADDEIAVDRSGPAYGSSQ